MIKISHYRKKPVVIQAVKLEDGVKPAEVAAWCGGEVHNSGSNRAYIAIQTLEGTMTAAFGDYIIKGIENEFYPCKPNIFKATYEEVGDEAQSN